MQLSIAILHKYTIAFYYWNYTYITNCNYLLFLYCNYLLQVIISIYQNKSNIFGGNYMTRKEKIKNVENVINAKMINGEIKEKWFFDSAIFYFIAGVEPTLSINDSIEIVNMYRDILTDN